MLIKNSNVLVSTLLFFTATLSLIFNNSPIIEYYSFIYTTEININIYKVLNFNNNLHHIINDIIMTIYFFFIGLELKKYNKSKNFILDKKEIINIYLSTILAMFMPALIYIIINYHNGDLQGWAIPTSTDIAFTISIISIIKNFPTKLVMFILMIAIFDDLISIIIVTIFYTKKINFYYFFLSILLLGFLSLRNNMNSKIIFMLILSIIWLFLVFSGINPTFLGMITARFLIKISNRQYYILKNIINFVLIPIFAFLNVGFSINTIDIFNLSNPISIGIILGMFLGKPLGIILGFYVLRRVLFFKFDKDLDILSCVGLGLICGIGCTMSIFISNLAFCNNIIISEIAKCSIFLGSLISGIIGYLILKYKFNYSKFYLNNES